MFILYLGSLINSHLSFINYLSVGVLSESDFGQPKLEAAQNPFGHECHVLVGLVPLAHGRLKFRQPRILCKLELINNLPVA